MPKSVKNYTEERQNVINELFKILEINETNKKFSLSELDQNEEKQQKILALEPDIKKYFLCSRWNFFSHKYRDSKRNYLSLIRSLCNDMNIEFISSYKNKKIDDKNKKETYYYFDIQKYPL
jgi:hypothetical protein